MQSQLDNPFAIGAPICPPASAGILGVEGDSVMMNIPHADYLALTDSVSCSQLKMVLRSPAHHLARLARPPEETASQRLGSALHCAVLEPARFAAEYRRFDGQRRGSRWEDFVAQHPGRRILSLSEHDAVIGMRAAIRNFDYPCLGSGMRLATTLSAGLAERSLFWTDADGGLRCRVRPDLVDRAYGLILDLKTTDDARPESFLRQMLKLHYDLQAAMYIEGVRAFSGRYPTFCFVAVETAPPHGVWLYEIKPRDEDEVWARGRAKFRAALVRYRVCQERSHWPGYEAPFSASGFSLPRWVGQRSNAASLPSGLDRA